MGIAATAAGLALALTSVSSGAGAPKPITGAAVVAVQSWVDAVRSHTPGQADTPVATVAAFSYETREELNAGLALFFKALLGRTYNTQNNAAAKAIAGIGKAARNPDADSFLKQAAILHSDVAAYGDRFPLHSGRSPTAPPPAIQELQFGGEMAMPTRIQPGEPVPPLLTQNRLILDQDGQILGEVVASWNWPFARSLLDLVQARDSGPARDRFVAEWYHATTAYMFASGTYGDLTPHLQRAADLFPDDSWIQFDGGCYAELLGLPMHQALRSERDVVDQRLGGRDTAASSAAWSSPTWKTPSSTTSLRIPTAEKTNAEAERLYRRALAIDPSLVEARVRLARLLDLRQRHVEAAAELKMALSANPRNVVAFYADLFAGRVAQGMGQADQAAGHYQDALRLFPDAQSALLASSQLALLSSDVAATLAPVGRLGARSDVFTADPWWQYHLCAGRDAEDLLKALWTRAPR